MAEDLLREQKELLLRLFEEKTYVPMKLKELAVFLDIPKARREELKAVLDILLEEGKIGISAKGKYGRPGILPGWGFSQDMPGGSGLSPWRGRSRISSSRRRKRPGP